MDGERGPAIRIEGLEKAFGAAKALDGFELEVARGKVVGLLGPNGAGKTTCMKVLAGLLHANRGTVRVLGGDPWTAPPERRRSVGYLSEEGFPWPKLTFRKAVAFTSAFFPQWDGAFVERLAELLTIPIDTRIGQM